ncbi:MAG: apolipoprotein N-acyltransferase [Caulobacter sp.]|nr:apolipoprotein N-acyltransferase [Caulobacter sp.]
MTLDLARIPRWVLALAAGAAAALAHPPFGLLPGLLGYALLLWLVDTVDSDRPLRSAFWRGWLAGVAYFAIGTWWIAEAFLVDIVHHGWMAPLAVSFMAGGIALFWGAACLTYRWIGGAPGAVGRVLLFAAVFAGFEWLRGHVLTGFPWNLVGETWKAGSAMSQTAALVGAYGLTLITLAIAASAAVWREGRAGRIALGLAAATLVGLWSFGACRTAGTAESPPAATALTVRIVQADIKQSAKYDPAEFQRIVTAYVSLTARPYPGGRPADIVVWPEGAIPDAVNSYLAPGTWTRAAIEDVLAPGQVLLVGAYRVEGTQADYRAYNSLIAVRRTAAGLEPAGVYDKFRLVPFGEFLPLDGLMTALGVKTLVHVGDGFTSGPPPRPLQPDGLPAFQPLICYEGLYPGFTRAGAKASGIKPDFIVNASNDAWFGATSGPLQHLNLSSYRAIEEGIPIIRSTPTGVSTLVDATGRAGDKILGLGESGVIDQSLPQQRFETLYRRLGDLPFLLLLLISGFIGLRFRVVSVLKSMQNRF